MIKPNNYKPSEIDQSNYQPELNLWAAVFGRALDELNYKGKKPIELIAKRQAKTWFKSDRDNGLGSFVSLCHLFNIDKEKVRKRLITIGAL